MAVDVDREKARLETRMHRVRVLLFTLDDYLPAMKTGARIAEGPAPSKFVPCADCRETGRLGVKLCPVCDGYGWRRRQAGDPAFDAYTRERIADETPAKPRTMTLRELDQTIDRLERITNKPVDEFDPRESFKWEREKAIFNRAGSYEELRRVLKELRDVSPVFYRRALRIAATPLDQELPPELDRTLVLLASSMRGEIRVPHWAEQDRAEKRKQEARRLRLAGVSVSEIARTLGIERGKVKKLTEGVA